MAETTESFRLLGNIEDPIQRARELKEEYLRRLQSDLPLEELAEQLAQEQIQREQLIATDTLLTGLFKHSYFVNLLKLEAESAKRIPAPDSALLAFDLDHFGAFNNRFGHPAGDELLIACGQAILRSIRSGDAPGRIGGDELGVIARRTTMEGAIAAARRIQDAIIQASQQGRFAEWKQTISTGICLIGPGYPPDLIREAADKALYGAKKAGRNRIAIGVIDPETNSITTRVAAPRIPILSR